jgi:hypothetical protein
MSVQCSQCGADLEGFEQGVPCPQCGGIKRNVIVSPPPLQLTVTLYPPTVIVVKHWDRLLHAAERLFAAGEFAVSVVVAATACEVIAERAITKAFANKKVPELEAPVTKYLSSYSLDGDRNRKLYNALTGDNIQKQSFWEPYTTLVRHRQESVHSGKDISEADAKVDIDAATQFVNHVERHSGLA